MRRLKIGEAISWGKAWSWYWDCYCCGMNETVLILLGVLPVVLIVALGALLRVLGVFKPEMEKGLMQLVVHILLPALTLVSVVGNEALRGWGKMGSALGFGYGSVVVGLAVAYLAACALKMERGQGKRTFTVASGVQNSSYMAIPLLLELFPESGALGVLFTYNVGVDLALWTIGVMVMSGDPRVSWRIFLKGPVIAVVLGLALNQMGGEVLLDGVPGVTLQMLGNCAIPVALLVIGAGLVDLLHKARPDWKVATGSVAVRLLLVPACMIVAAYALPISGQLAQVMVIQAAMPAAMFPIVLAKHYGGRPEVAVQVVAATTLACFVTMPSVVMVGKRVLGL
ncbi:AEC family transporter [Rubritalea tangerina]|uniref:AEC family transporter n=1 Tax=Rubritalea tangerina TaxID=430798 RepID=A0ABW4ZFQ3_9BACT